MWRHSSQQLQAFPWCLTHSSATRNRQPLPQWPRLPPLSSMVSAADFIKFGLLLVSRNFSTKSSSCSGSATCMRAMQSAFQRVEQLTQACSVKASGSGIHSYLVENIYEMSRSDHLRYTEVACSRAANRRDVMEGQPLASTL